MNKTYKFWHLSKKDRKWHLNDFCPACGYTSLDEKHRCHHYECTFNNTHKIRMYDSFDYNPKYNPVSTK